MAGSWPVFVTAGNVSPKKLNKAFLLLQDFEFKGEGEPPEWVLITSSDPSENSTKPTCPPLEPIGTNAFTNLTPDDINSWILANEEIIGAMNMLTSTWVIIDQEGLDNETCIVADYITEKEEPYNRTDKYNATRLPLTSTWSMVCNLEISNMGFEEWVDEDKGVQPNGLWQWVGPFKGTLEAHVLEELVRDPDQSVENRVAKITIEELEAGVKEDEEKFADELKLVKKREAALKALRDQGHVD